MGSTIVDGPEVPKDRDPAQREAEGPRSSMDFSEFLSPKKTRSSSVTTPRNRRSVRRPMEGSEVTTALYGKNRIQLYYTAIDLYTRTGKEKGTMLTENGEH